MSVQHQARATAGPSQGGDGLKPPRLNFLEAHFVLPVYKEIGQERGHRSLFQLETGDLYQITSQVYNRLLVNLVNDL